MNSFKGNITSIRSSGSLSLVSVAVQKVKLTAIVIDTPESSSYLKVGNEINVIFKETEVVLGKGNSLEISLQNKAKGIVKTIEKGELLSKVTLQTEIGEIVSVITSRAVTQLGLQESSEAVAMVKTNEIMLAE